MSKVSRGDAFVGVVLGIALLILILKGWRFAAIFILTEIIVMNLVKLILGRSLFHDRSKR